MKPVYKSLPEYIESGEYFTDARTWYKYKYISPFTQRSFIFILSIIICAQFVGIIMHISGLLPLSTQVQYSIEGDTSANNTAKIVRANHIDNQPLKSITDIMVRNYVTQRENYNYDRLHQQFLFIKNNSTRIIFRRFYNFMNIDNPSSPVIRYQREINRVIDIISADYPHNTTNAIVVFNSIAKDVFGNVKEDKIWQAALEYEIDDINTELPPGSRFNFTVTNYTLELLEDKLKK